jgi:hypothetical protein
LNGKSIKKNTVAGKALKKDTLGAREIKESKLTKVPSAVAADTAIAASTAALATNAESVGGTSVKPINQLSTPTATPEPQELYSRGAMKIMAVCLTGLDYPSITAVSSANGGIAASSLTTGSPGTPGSTFDGVLDAGESTYLYPGALTFSTTYDITLRNADGLSATVLLSAVKSTLPGGGPKCRYTGVAFGV